MIDEFVSSIAVSLTVMVVLGTTIHEFACNRMILAYRNSWVVGPSPTMTRWVRRD